LEFKDGLVPLSVLAQRDAEIIMNQCIIRLQCQRLLVLDDGLRRLSLGNKGAGKSVVNLGKLRLEERRLPALKDRLVSRVLPRLR
jgi:hypothetical protein